MSFRDGSRGRPGEGLPPHDPATCSECAAELQELDALDGLGPCYDDDAGWRPPELGPDADLGDIVIVLLVSTLAGLRDRLHKDGFDSAATLVEDLIEVADDYVLRLPP